MRSELRWWGRRLATVACVAAAASGCGWILGLDEFVDAPPSGAGGGGAGGAGGTGGEATCEGEATPAAETCASPADEDCDGQDCVLWARMFGDVTAQSVDGIAAAPDGSIYIAGSFTGTLEFPPRSPISANGTDIYLAKLDGSGRGLWSKSFPTSSGQGSVAGIAVDAQGGVFVAGTITGSTDFDGTVLDPMGFDSVYVVKLDTEGLLQWANLIALSDAHRVARPAIDPNGSLIVFGSRQCVSACLPETSRLWIRKFDAAGAEAWHKWFNEVGGLTSHELGGITADPFGNVVLAASFTATETFGGHVFTNNSGFNILILKLDAQGNYIWSSNIDGGDGTLISRDIASDPQGDITIAARFSGTLTLAPGVEHAATAGDDIVVATVSSANAHLWSRSFGSADDDDLDSIAVDSDGDVTLTARLGGIVDFGGGPLTAAGDDLALVKLDATGAHLWSRVLAGRLNGSKVAAAPTSGEALLGCSAEGDVNVGSGPLRSAGAADVLVGRFAR